MPGVYYSMRTVKYRIWYGVGKESAPWMNEALEEFILKVVAARHVNGFVLQPLHFINEILKKGETEIGVGYQWKPFELDESEYQELIDILCTDPTKKVTTEAEFNNAKNLHDWRMKVGRKYRQK